MKKYELVPQEDSDFFRIRALRDFAEVKKGDLGGFVQSEENLSHYDDCWIFDDAVVSGNAVVFGNAVISGNSRISGSSLIYGITVISGNVKIYDNVEIYGNARIFDDVEISGDSEIYGNATVLGNVKICDESRISGNAVVFGDAIISGRTAITEICSKTPQCIYWLPLYKVTITDNHIKIGCECHTIDEWLNFTNEEILAMDEEKALVFWEEHKHFILSAALHHKIVDV